MGREVSVAIASVKLFKNVELFAGEKQHKLQSAQAKLLIAYCVESQDSLSRSALATLFWPDRSESEGLKLLRNLLNRITKALPNLLEVNRYSVQLITTDNSFDTLEVQALSKSSSIEDWQRAVSLYTGPFLEKISQKNVPEDLEEWLELRRQFYQHNYVNSLHKLVHALSDSSDTKYRDFELAMFYAQAWQKEEPNNERIYIHQLSMLVQQQKYDELEQHYEHIQTLPLTDLCRTNVSQYYQTLEIPKAQDRPVAVVKKSSIKSKTILGRSGDIEQITTLLKKHRLVTLTGIGGIGKTHITQTIVAEQNLDFADGVIFLSLTLTDTSQLFNHLMRALGIYRSGLHDPKEEIIKGLRNKNLLLVLDNAEHLTAVLGPFLSKLISQTSHIKCLVSSRRKLSITSEQLYPLGDLGVPESNSSLESLQKMPTAQLLVQHAQNLNQNLDFTEDHKETIIRLCQISHGLPLAIEIVAANLRKISLDTIENPETLENLTNQSLNLTKPVTTTATLRQSQQHTNPLTTHLANGTSLSEPLQEAKDISTSENINASLVEQLREGGQEKASRRKTPRLRTRSRHTSLQHDSLKNCFEYSWSLLEEKHQEILAKQACFFGGFSFKAFTEVTAGDAYDLAVLVNASLVRRTPSGRYERHPLIYQFCRQKLKELPNLNKEMEAKHAHYFVDYALELQEYLDNYQPDTAVKLEPEVSNFLRAIRFSVNINDVTMIEPLFLTLTSYLGTQGRYHEAIDHCKAVVQLNVDKNQNPIIDFFLHLWIVFFYSQSGNISEAETNLQYLEQLLTVLENDVEMQITLTEHVKDIPFFLGIYELVKGMHLDNQSLFKQAQPHFERVIELQKPFLESHSNTTSLLARNRLAFEHVYLGELEKAQALYEENLAHGEYFLQPLDTICLGELLMYQKDAQAEITLLKGLALSQQKKMPLIQSIAHQYLGIFYVDNDEQKALEHLNDAINISKEISEFRVESYTLSAGLGQLYIKTKQWLEAQSALQASLELSSLWSAKLRMLSALMRLSAIDLHLDCISQKYQDTALACLELVTKHPASHFVDKEKAADLLSQHYKGQLQQHSLSSEQQVAYENNRNNKLLKSIIEVLSSEEGFTSTS